MNDRNVRWIKIMAGAATLIGAAGLIALMAEGSWAQTPTRAPMSHSGPARSPAAGGPDAAPEGFRSGARPLPGAGGNPFMGSPPAGGRPSFFPDDDEDDTGDDDFDQPTYPGRPAVGGVGGGPGARNQGNAGGGNAGAPGPIANTPRGISLGGGPPGGVIQGNRVAPLRVDTETAEGCKDVVTDFNFPDADIMDIAKALGKLTGKNFILDKDVKGRITIISNSQITCGDAWKAFLTALDVNGFAIIPSGGYLRIARQRDARDKQLPTYTGDFAPDTDALITRLFPLKYLSAEEVARNFRSFMPANSRIIPYEQTNTVIVTDTGANITKLAKLLEILDIEGYDAGIEVIPVKYASAVELSKLIDTLIPGTAAGAGPGGPPRFGGGFGASRFSARRTKEGGIINTIIADERTNTLIVHANTKGADQVRELVTKLDQKLPATTAGGKVHVIYLQFAEAEQIAQTLNNISQSAGAPRPVGPTGGTGVNPVQSSLFEGAIKISPDKATNSLVITASPTDFVTVQRVVNKLDIPRDQVFAEVIIMEITLGREFQFSTNFVNPTSGIFLAPNADLAQFIANPLSQKGAILGFKAGQTVNYTINGASVPVASVQALVTALQTRSNGNILATPQILALDNTEATFETAEKIPVPQISQTNVGTTTGYTKENVSLSITVKPQINKIANFVKMDITTKLADISGRELPKQVADAALATFERNAKTSVVVADGDTVVLGGLVRDNQQEQISKVPILGDIPLLGWLFKSKKTQTTKTNLLMFITPHIVRQYETVRAILDKKLQQRDDFLESTSGGDDPLRKYRDDMIRSLPDIKELTSKRPETAFTIDDEPHEKPAAKEVTNPEGTLKPEPKTETKHAAPHETAPEPAPTATTPAAPTAPAQPEGVAPGGATPPGAAGADTLAPPPMEGTVPTAPALPPDNSPPPAPAPAPETGGSF